MLAYLFHYICAMYSKDFDGRNTKKQQINNMVYSRGFYIKPREIWVTSLGVNIGNETDGKGEFLRPVLVIAKVGSVFRVLPMTTKGKDSSIFYQ